VYSSTQYELLEARNGMKLAMVSKAMVVALGSTDSADTAWCLSFTKLYELIV